MTTRRDHHEAAVLDVVGGSVLALEVVRDEIARLRFHLRSAEVGRGARRAHGAGHQTRRRRRLLEVSDALDLTRREGMAHDHGGLLDERHVQAARFEARAIELAPVERAPVGGHDDPMAERVLATRIKGEAGLQLALRDFGKIR